VAKRVATGEAKQLQLARAARVAGEAFGCDDGRYDEIVGSGRLLWLGSLTSAFIGIVAVAALYTGF
jgi:hypothetical protein